MRGGSGAGLGWGLTHVVSCCMACRVPMALNSSPAVSFSVTLIPTHAPPFSPPPADPASSHASSMLDLVNLARLGAWDWAQWRTRGESGRGVWQDENIWIKDTGTLAV